MIKTPSPLHNQTLVHGRSINDSKSPKTFRASHNFPFNHYVFLFVIHGIP